MQELQRVWAAYRPETKTAAPQLAFTKADGLATCCSIYLWEAKFGPAFTKACSYFPRSWNCHVHSAFTTARLPPGGV